MGFHKNCAGHVGSKREPKKPKNGDAKNAKKFAAGGWCHAERMSCDNPVESWVALPLESLKTEAALVARKHQDWWPAKTKTGQPKQREHTAAAAKMLDPELACPVEEDNATPPASPSVSASSPPPTPALRRREDVLRLKFHHRRAIRVVNVRRGESVSFRALKQRLTSDYGFELALAYQDADGDLITLASQNDLNELLDGGAAAANVRVMKLEEDPAHEDPQDRGRVSPLPGHYVADFEAEDDVLTRDSPPTSPATPRRSRKLHALISSPTPHSSAKIATLDPLRAPASPLPPQIDEGTPRRHLMQPIEAAQTKSPEKNPERRRLDPLDRRPQYDEGSLAESLSDDNQPQELRPRSAKVAPQPQERRIRWQRGELVGKGAFGTVYLGLNLDTGELMAVKMLEAEEVSSRERHALENEVQTMRGLSHPNIVRYLGVDSQKNTLAIFLEYVSGGSLRSLLDRFGRLEERVVRLYGRQILLGLEYLHANGIAHRDVKAANTLLSQDGIVKLADFGASKRTREIAGDHLHATGGHAKGTPLWMAPEVIKSSQKNSWRKADVWSVGCTVIEMATGRPPWSQYSNPVTAMYHIACVEELPDLPPSLGPDGHEFLVSCFNRDPELRPQVSALLLQRFVATRHRQVWREPWTNDESVRRPMTASATEGLSQEAVRRSHSLRVVTDATVFERQLAASDDEDVSPARVLRRQRDEARPPPDQSITLDPMRSPRLRTSSDLVPLTSPAKRLPPAAEAYRAEKEEHKRGPRTERKIIRQQRRVQITAPGDLEPPRARASPRLGGLAEASPPARDSPRPPRPRLQGLEDDRLQVPVIVTYAATAAPAPDDGPARAEPLTGLAAFRGDLRAHASPVRDDDDPRSPHGGAPPRARASPRVLDDDVTASPRRPPALDDDVVSAHDAEVARRTHRRAAELDGPRSPPTRTRLDDDVAPEADDRKPFEFANAPPRGRIPPLGGGLAGRDSVGPPTKSPDRRLTEAPDKARPASSKPPLRESPDRRAPAADALRRAAALHGMPSAERRAFDAASIQRQFAGSLLKEDRAYDPHRLGRRPEEQRRPFTEGSVLQARPPPTPDAPRPLLECDSDDDLESIPPPAPEERDDLVHRGAPITCIAAAPGGGFLACASTDGRVVVMDYREEECRIAATLRPALESLKGARSPAARIRSRTAPAGVLDRAALADATPAVGTCVLTTNGARCVTGSDDGIGRVWCVETEQLLHALEGHNGTITKVQVLGGPEARDQRRGTPWAGCVVTASSDHTVRLWDVRLRKPQTMVLRGHADSVNALVVDQDHVVWSASRDTSIRAWDLRCGRQRFALTQHFGAITTLVLDPTLDNGKGGVLSGARDTTVHVWARASGACMRALRSQRGFVQALAVIPKATRSSTPTNPGSTVACGATNGKIRLWDHHRGKQVRAWEAHALAVTAVAFTPCAGSGLLVTGGADGLVKAWEARTGACRARCLANHGASVVALAVVDGAEGENRPRVFSAAKDGCLRLKNL